MAQLRRMMSGKFECRVGEVPLGQAASGSVFSLRVRVLAVTLLTPFAAVFARARGRDMHHHVGELAIGQILAQTVGDGL